MADTDVKQLLLQVDATVELLRKNLDSAERRVASFERDVDRRMAQADGHFAKLGKGIAGVNEGLSQIRAAAAAAIAAGLTVALVAATKRGLEYASSLGEVAQQLGVSTDALQEYRYAATQVGIEQETIDKSLAKLTKTIGEAVTGGKKQKAAFDALGISLRDANGNIKDAGDVIPELADGLAKIPDSARRAALETTLFGRAGQQLDTLLAGGSKAVNELRKAAHDLGLVLSEEEIQKADETADKLSELNQVLSARIASVVAENATSIYNLASAVAKLTAEGINFVNNWPKLSAALTGAAIGARLGGLPGAAIGGAVGLGVGTRAAEAQAQGNMDLGFRRQRQQAALEDYNRQRAASKSPAFYAVAERRLRQETALLRQATALARSKGKGAAPVETAADIGDLDLSGGGGGSNSKGGGGGPSAAEIERSFADDLVNYAQRVASARASMATSAEERAELELQQVEREHRSRLDDIEHKKGYSKAKKDDLRAAEEQLVFEERAQVERRRQEQIERDAADIAEASYRAQAEALQGQYDLTENNAERRKLADEILDLEYRYKRSILDAIINSPTASDTDKRRAGIARDALAGQRQVDQAKADRENETPGERYMRELSKEAINLGDAYEDAAVNGLRRLNDSLAESAKSALGLHGVLGDIVGDLIEIAIRQAVIGPLASAIFGGGGGGFLGGIFGGFRAGGGPVSAGRAYVVGEKRPELFVPRVSGNIVPRVPGPGSGGGGDTTLAVTINAPGATAETVMMIRREIASAAPGLLQAASGVTARELGRRRL